MQQVKRAPLLLFCGREAPGGGSILHCGEKACECGFPPPRISRAQQVVRVGLGQMCSCPATHAVWQKTRMHSSFSFRQGLSERGFVEGRDVGIEHHYEQGQPNRLPSLATDLVWRLVAIVANIRDL